MSTTECQKLKSNTRTLFGRTTNISTPLQKPYAAAASTSQNAISPFDTVGTEKELVRLVAKLLQDGMLLLATNYALRTEKDLVPHLRAFVSKETLDEYSELLQELR